MPHIVILSASVRTGRRSHRVAHYFQRFIALRGDASCEIVDLAACDFPIFHERLRHTKDPAANVLDFAQRIKSADGVVIVSPEYNGGYPAGLKNAIDLLYDEWHRKPVAISTVSDGSFGGAQVLTSLQFSLWKIRTWTVPAMFPVPKVQEMFDEEGNATDTAGVDKRATGFINELMWCITAKQRMDTNP